MTGGDGITAQRLPHAPLRARSPAGDVIWSGDADRVAVAAGFAVLVVTIGPTLFDDPAELSRCPPSKLRAPAQVRTTDSLELEMSDRDARGLPATSLRMLRVQLCHNVVTLHRRLLSDTPRPSGRHHVSDKSRSSR